jgi:hypothetical protein
MPGFDGTGPRGMGPMTGGGRGFCSPFGARAAWQPWGAHRWAGYGYPYGPIPPREQELDFLKDEAQALRKTLEEIDARVKELAGEGK